MGIDLTTVEREDAKTAVLTVGAVRDLIERLDRLEDVGKRPGTISLPGVADATLELDRRVKELERAVAAEPSCATAELLQALRAAGVTRYQAGELAIELNPAAAPGPRWVPGGVSEPPNAAIRYRIAAEALWGLLDDIDTADDMAKSDEALYRGLVRGIAARRFEHATSLDGGEHLTWSWQKHDPPVPRPLTLVDSGAIDNDIPDDVPEPIESPSGIEVDHEALRVKLEERKRATGRAKG